MSKYAPPRESISPKPTRDQEEYDRLDRLDSVSKYPMSKKVRELLASERRERYFLEEDYTHNIYLDKKMLEIFRQEYESLASPVLIEILRRAGMFVNNDAQSYELIDGVVEEGEGLKLFKKANEIANELTEDTGESLSDADYKDVMENIKQGNILERILNREEQLSRLNAEILTGLDLHPLILVQDPTNKDSYLCVAFMTSADDEGTVFLGDTQSYAGKEISKKQYIRPLTQVTRVPKDQVRVNDKVELPKEKIIDAIIKKEEEKKYPSFQDANIGKPIVLDKAKLIQIGICLVEERLATTKKTLDEYKDELAKENKEQSEKNLNKKRFESEKYENKKIEDAKDKNLPRIFRLLRKIQKLFEENIAQYIKDKEKKEKKEEKAIKVAKQKALAEEKKKAKQKALAEEKKKANDKNKDEDNDIDENKDIDTKLTK
jgi:hypothetical protein